MLTIITICLAILTGVFILVSIYFVSVLSSLKKTIEEIGELVVYIKSEIYGLREPITKGLSTIEKIRGFINETSERTKAIKNKIITPCAFILGIYAGIKAFFNVLKGGDKRDEKKG